MKASFESPLESHGLEGFKWRKPEGPRDLNSFKDIVVSGCTILMVYADDAKETAPFDFIYTVGFYLNLRHPELFIMGQLNGTAGNMMNSLFTLVQQGKKVEDGHTSRYDFWKGERTLMARSFPQEMYDEYLGWGCWFYRSLRTNNPPKPDHNFPVLQLFWPDEAGLYPWDEACDPVVKSMQSLRGNPLSI